MLLLWNVSMKGKQRIDCRFFLHFCRLPAALKRCVCFSDWQENDTAGAVSFQDRSINGRFSGGQAGSDRSQYIKGSALRECRWRRRRLMLSGWWRYVGWQPVGASSNVINWWMTYVFSENWENLPWMISVGNWKQSLPAGFAGFVTFGLFQNNQ